MVIRPADASPYLRTAQPLGHCGLSADRYFVTHIFGALFPLCAGLALFGFRALLVTMIVVASSLATAFFWKRIGARGGQVRYSHVIWLSITLVLMLPAHLADANGSQAVNSLLILPLAGALLVCFGWVLGGIGAGRIHPVVVTFLLLSVVYSSSFTSTAVLQRNRMVLGDVLDAGRGSSMEISPEPWFKSPIVANRDAIATTPAAVFLSSYTTGQLSPDRAWLSLESLLRDRMPPPEDVILGSVPGPLGTTSAIAVVIGGLFLLYRGLIDYRIPLLITLACFVTLLILPVPAVITDKPEWRWCLWQMRGVGFPMAATFANYEILASPLLFMAFFVATAPPVRPLTCKGRVLYSIGVGVLAAVFQLYVSVTIGCYLALLTASLLTPIMDKWLRPRALI